MRATSTTTVILEMSENEAAWLIGQLEQAAIDSPPSVLHHDLAEQLKYVLPNSAKSSVAPACAPASRINRSTRSGGTQL